MYPVEHFPVLIVGLALFCGFTMLLAGYTSRRLPFFMSLAMNSVFLIMSYSYWIMSLQWDLSATGWGVEASLGH